MLLGTSPLHKAEGSHCFAPIFAWDHTHHGDHTHQSASQSYRHKKYTIQEGKLVTVYSLVKDTIQELKLLYLLPGDAFHQSSGVA